MRRPLAIIKVDCTVCAAGCRPACPGLVTLLCVVLVGTCPVVTFLAPRFCLMTVVFLPQNNELLREIFELGPPLVLDAAAIKASKISRFEKVRWQPAGTALPLQLSCFVSFFLVQSRLFPRSPVNCPVCSPVATCQRSLKTRLESS